MFIKSKNGFDFEFLKADGCLHLTNNLMYLLCLQILLGNSDTFNVATNVLNPPLIASAIRILPYSNHSRTVCLRLGLIGCPFQGLIFYIKNN